MRKKTAASLEVFLEQKKNSSCKASTTSFGGLMTAEKFKDKENRMGRRMGFR